MSTQINLKLWHKFIFTITTFFRRRRAKFLLSIFPDIEIAKICDLGGSRHFWESLNINVPKENITIYNISKNETNTVASKKYNDINFWLYNGENIPVEDNEFDILVCNSVLEHVPMKNRFSLVKEMSRISKNLICQTPAYSFPFEPHFVFPFIHWLPKKIGYYLTYITPWRILSRLFYKYDDV